MEGDNAVTKIRKELIWIGLAILFLCAVTAYRQFSIRFLPSDPARPVIVYVVYLLVLAGWWGAICSRMARSNMRTFMLAEHAAMLFWITLRLVQESILYRDTLLMRVSGYFIAVPMILIPLFGLFASFGLGKDEEYRISRKWYILLIPAGILILLMLTNESHHLIFRVLPNEIYPNLYFHPNTGLYVIIFWSLALEIARIAYVNYRSREIGGNSHLKKLPFMITMSMLVVCIPHVVSSFVVGYEIIEFSVAIFLFEALVWESCFLAGMVPVNTHYEEVFDRSTVTMQIVDEQGQSYIKSACAKAMTADVFARLKQQPVLRTADGQEIHLHAIAGGYAVWHNDISQTVSVIEELEKSVEKLEYEGELLRQELKVRSDEAAVREKNRIYNQLSEEIGDQLLLLQKLLDKREWVNDKSRLFKQVCLIGTYIKRRCNLRLIEQSDGVISNNELKFCFQDLISCLEQMEINVDIHWNAADTPEPEFAIFTLDLFEFILEREHLKPCSIGVTFESEIEFTVWVYSGRHSGNVTSGQVQAADISRINKRNYDISCHYRHDGYQVSVRGGGD